MLSNILGLLIAFVTIMLLLSMMVTGLVQATQSLFRLRSRNLLKCVGTLLKTLEVLPQQMTRWETRQQAALVLNHESVASVDQVAHPMSFLRQGLFGPKVSWAEPSDLARAIRAQVEVLNRSNYLHASLGRQEIPAGAASQDALVGLIERMQPAWSKRFQYFIRLVTIGWSLIVAIGFQLSAPALFSALARDPQRMSVITASQRELLQQLQSVLAGDPQRPEVLHVYAKHIDALLQKHPAAAHEPSGAIDQLAQLGIDWFPHGWGYYIDAEHGWRVAALIGVLMSGILLSFGAPFWFEQLRNLAALRDLRAPPTPPSQMPAKTSLPPPSA